MYEKSSIPNINNGTIKTHNFFFLQRVQSLEGGFTVIGDTQRCVSAVMPDGNGWTVRVMSVRASSTL